MDELVSGSKFGLIVETARFKDANDMSKTLVELRAAKIPGWSGYFADHFWLLILKDVIGESYRSCERWEVWQHSNQNDTCWGHLHLNLLEPCQDCGNGPSRSVRIWEGKDAEDIIGKIHSAPESYPFNNKYRYWPGPNSNTFAQWVVRDKMKLPFRAAGRLYPVPKR